MEANRRRQWAQLVLEIRQADRRYWLTVAFYGAAAWIGMYLFTVAVLSLAHPY